MKPINFDQANRSATRTTDWRGKKRTETVHFYTNGASSVCKVDMTINERLRVLCGEPVWLIMKGAPSIFDMTVENPFMNDVSRPNIVKVWSTFIWLKIKLLYWYVTKVTTNDRRFSIRRIFTHIHTMYKNIQIYIGYIGHSGQYIKNQLVGKRKNDRIDQKS